MIFSDPINAANKLMIDMGHRELSLKFSTIVNFLLLNPEFSPKPRKKGMQDGSKEYFLWLGENFVKSRQAELPSQSGTIPDKMVGFVLQHYFETPESDLPRIEREHSNCMFAENIVGDLLERYIAATLEPVGWVWASGSTIKAIDFIFPPFEKGQDWDLLQVKNRDNSENSSSKAIRDGTKICKWFRSFSKKSGTNWENFPFHTSKDVALSEDGFKLFVENFLKRQK
jgi:hypothetical protein